MRNRLTNLIKLIYILVLSFYFSNSNGQNPITNNAEFIIDTIYSEPISIDSLVILSHSPIEGELITLKVDTKHSSSPCGLIDYNVMFSSNNTILVTARYWEGMLTAICNSSDKLVLGKLSAGNYVLNFMNRKSIEFTVFPKDSCNPDFTWQYPKCIDFAKCPNTVLFNDQSTGKPEKWYWNFGDSTFSREQNPMHTYKNSGIYNVCLSVSCGNSWCGWGLECISKPECKLVPVNVPCKADFTYELLPDYSMSATDTVNFAPFPSFIVRFTDASVGTPIKWLWNFGDGMYSNLQNPVHSFKAGKYAVSLSITTNYGCQSEYIDTLIFNNPPICQFSGTVKDYSGLDGCKFVIELDNGIKLEPVILPDSFQLRDKQRVILDYFPLKIMTTCMAGIPSDITCIREIPQPVCKAYFTWYKDTLANCICYQFNSQSIGNVFAYNWNFGDGTSSNVMNPKHSFPMNADSIYYNVCLTITTSDGCISSYCDEIFNGVKVPWIPIIGGDENHSIMVSKNLQTNFNIEKGDYVGLFFHDYRGIQKCGGMIRWDGNNNVLVAWANTCRADTVFPSNDTANVISLCKNGFNKGEHFDFKIWKWKTNEEIPVLFTKYQVNDLFPDSAYFKPDGLSLLIGASCYNTQNIALYKGWNMVSLNLKPKDLTMSQIFGNKNVIVKNYKGEIVYFPSMEIKEYYWNIFEGYKIKVFDNSTLTITGEPIFPQTVIPLNGNQLPYFLPYYYDRCYPIQQMMFAINHNIRYVQTFEYKNGILHALNYIPKYGIDQIKYMKSGLAYKLSLFAPMRSFSYPPVYIISDTIQNDSLGNTIKPLSLNEYESNRLLVVTKDVLSIPEGAEVTAFAKSGEMVGKAVSSGENMALTMWDIPQTLPYDEFTLKVKQNGISYEYNLSFSSNTVQDENLYVLDRLTNVSGLEIPEFKLRTYPTQVNDFLNMDITLDKQSDIVISIFNLLGQKCEVYNFKNIATGTTQLKLNMEKLPAGQYIYQVKTKNSVIRGKMQVSR